MIPLDKATKSEKIELNNDLIAAYNELEEVTTDYREFTDDELLKNRDTIHERLNFALHWLSKYVDDEDEIQEL